MPSSLNEVPLADSSTAPPLHLESGAWRTLENKVNNYLNTRHLKVRNTDRSLYVVLAVYGAISIVALALVPLRFLPAEDAVILFQYSRNLAEHGSITFMATGPHVEGATDFAWMVMVAVASRLGIPPFWFCAGINVVSLIGLSSILLRLGNRRLTPLRLLAVIGTIALVPQILAAASGFAVLPDACLLAALVFSATKRRVASSAVLALIFCLFRPDGLVYAVPLLVSLVVPQDSRRKNILRVLGLFAVPGMAYFLWRWSFFRELFPLPLLVKADTHRVLGIFVPLSFHQSFLYLLFAGALLLPTVFGFRTQHRWLIGPLIVCPTIFYWTMRLDQNVAARFFYYLPLSTALLIAMNWSRLGSRKLLIFRTGVVAWAVLLAMPLEREIRTFRDEQFWAVKDIAVAMSQLPKQGTVLVTEAGFLPYFSGWVTYDAWGLNTPEFAHHFFQRRDVERIRPDLILLHPDRPDTCLADSSWPSSYAERTSSHMTRNLVLGANPRDYQLWLTSYGSEYYRRRKHWGYGQGDRECWLIRKDSSVYGEIAQILRTHNAMPPDSALVLEENHGSQRGLQN